MVMVMVMVSGASQDKSRGSNRTGSEEGTTSPTPA